MGKSETSMDYNISFVFVISVSMFLSIISFQARTELVCAVLSDPVPSMQIYPIGEQFSNTHGQSLPDYFDKISHRKIILIGCRGSGTSTLFKQDFIDAFISSMASLEEIISLTLQNTLVHDQEKDVEDK